MSSRSRKQLESWLKGKRVAAERVLDVGGSQLPVKDRLGHLECSEYLIADLSGPHEERRKPDFALDIGVEWGEEWLAENLGRFDAVFCLEVFEYLLTPVTACRNLALLTRPGGRLYVSFPFLYPTHEPLREDALRYTEAGARRLLTGAGFEIEETDYRTADAYRLGEFYGSEGMRPSKNYRHHDAVAFNFVCVRR